MKKILVIGASGMVASRFIELADKKFEITPVDEKILDITDKKAVENYFAKNHFDSVVNFAAFTNVDGAESQKGDEKSFVWKLNVEGPSNLAKVCKKYDTFFVQISTDFVFPGNEKYPGSYNEDSKLPKSPEGIGWYGWTKNRAEAIIDSLSSSLSLKSAIIRYSYPFRAAKYDLKKDWARNLLSLYNEHKLYPLFNDQVQSILFIDDLVEPLSKILDQELIGIFHIASSDTTSPYEIGSYLLEKYAGKNVKLQKGSMAEFLKALGRALRPRLGGLKTEITQKKLGMKFKTWKEMVGEFVSQLKS